MRSNAKCYDVLRAYLETVPLIDCHDHTGQLDATKPIDPIRATLDGYIQNDMESAIPDLDIKKLVQDDKRSLAQRWQALEKPWHAVRFTGYGLVVRKALKHFYGEDDLNLEVLERIQPKLIDLSDPKNYEKVLEEAGIRVRIEDVWMNAAAIDGTLQLPPRSRLAISLPAYHAVKSYDEVAQNVAVLKRKVTSLDEYIEACRDSFARCKQAGAVCFKDQSAYSRTLAYDNPTRAEAETAFNWFMADPRRSLSYPDGNKPLGDYLFHTFMRMARDLDLPVQIHTGHMAGRRNDIRKTNAIGLTNLVELHRDTLFDLFHANWPYSGELLYLGKNYANVRLDFCWANMIDPIYCQQMFQQAVATVPFTKIHGYGSDLDAEVTCNAWAHADLAHDNIAIALSNLVEMEYLGLEEAKEIAFAWMFGNANEFFRLGIKA